MNELNIVERNLLVLLLEDKIRAYLLEVPIEALTVGSAELQYLKQLYSARSKLKGDLVNIYEIYVYNDKDIDTGNYTGSKAGTISGWEIKWIKTNKDIINYPFFDCIITTNDMPAGVIPIEF